MKLFVTGEPGSGKTTLIQSVVDRLTDEVSMTGFLTEEEREDGRRKGFRGRTLDGRTFPLAALGGESDFRVGPYHVTLEGLEQVGVPALIPRPDTRLVVLDEVGKMESFSSAFRERVLALLDGDVPLLATVAVHGVGFVKRVRHDPRITILRLRPRSRAGVEADVLRRLWAAGLGSSRRSAPPSE